VQSIPHVKADQVVGDAEWLPWRLDPVTRAVTFVRVPRAAHEQLTFLSSQYLAEASLTETVTLPIAAIEAALGEAIGLHFIFHSAFCASTLLARAVTVPGTVRGLREPELMNTLCALARERRLSRDDLRLALHLLARPLDDGEAIVIKPGNVANLLIEEAMQAMPSAKAVLLHAPLRAFLGSVAAKGLWGRTWARKLYVRLVQDFGSPFGYAQAELFEQTDLQIAALAWLLHQRQFAAVARRMPDRVRTLDSATFLANREATIANVASHFGVTLAAGEIAAILSGPAFARDAKKADQDFVPREAAAGRSDGDDEIDMICQWAAAVAAHADIPLELPLETRLL